MQQAVREMQPKLSTASLPDPERWYYIPILFPPELLIMRDAEIVFIWLNWLIRITPSLFIPFCTLYFLERFDKVQRVKVTAIIYLGCGVVSRMSWA
jgi:hypothetical protein